MVTSSVKTITSPAGPCLGDDEQGQNSEEQCTESDEGQNHQLQGPVVGRQYRGAQVDQQDPRASGFREREKPRKTETEVPRTCSKKWRFPEMGLPQNHANFSGLFLYHLEVAVRKSPLQLGNDFKLSPSMIRLVCHATLRLHGRDGSPCETSTQQLWRKVPPSIEQNASLQACEEYVVCLARPSEKLFEPRNVVNILLP